jgi:hypothetical protein
MPKWNLLGGAGHVLTFVATGVAFVVLFTGLGVIGKTLRRGRLKT